MKSKSQSLSMTVIVLDRLLAEGRRITHLPAVSATTAVEAVLGELERLRAERGQTPAITRKAGAGPHDKAAAK